MRKEGKMGCHSVLMLNDLLLALKRICRQDIACIFTFAKPSCYCGPFMLPRV